MNWYYHNSLLLSLLALGTVFCRQKPQLQIPFAFTAKFYNVSLEENAPGTEFARSSDHVPIGVPLPHSDATVKFKIVEGDRQHRFKAHSRQIGDFVFLRIRQKDRMDTPLNRELRGHYDFLVKATCRQKEAGNLEATSKVRLTITDRNDAMPIFTLEAQQYEATITDQTPPFTDVIRVEASDADEGINGQIYYSLVNRSADFTVDPVTGWIRSLRHLRSGVYNLKVRSEDRTSRLFYNDPDQIQPAWMKDVVIRVTESKRRHLKLLVASEQINGYRSDVQQLAAVVRVDMPPNEATLSGPIHVGIVEDDLKHWFSIVESGNLEWRLYTVPGKLIPLKTNVTLSAGQELASNGMVNTTANIKIEIGEPHSIAFNDPTASFYVEESVPLGYVVGKVSASALYKQDEKNIRYYLEMRDNTTVPFQVSEKSGIVRVASELDYEIQREYNFNILAKLAGFGGQSSIILKVYVKDTNDHSPVWSAKWKRQGPVAISNDYAIGETILKVDASDLDSGENARVGYKLTSNSEAPFQINFETGEISLHSPLKTDENNWNVTVWAIDSGRPLSRSAVLNLIFYRNGTKIPAKPKQVVGIEPVNKHAPLFEEFLTPVAILEDSAVGTEVITAYASDADVGYGGLVRFSIWDDYFSIDTDSGLVRVSGDLTELMTSRITERHYEIEIIASDDGSPRRSSKTKLQIDIIDVNNHAPQFQEHWYRIHVSEDTQVSTVLMKFIATDDDAGENGRVGYRLAGEEGDYVRIDEKSGELTLSRVLDREANDILRYAVIAFDHGTPSQISIVNLTIEVQDVNDNAPFCLEPITTVRIPEDYPDGALVGCVAATDADIGANARLRFSIEPEHNGLAPPFRIDHRTGCVFIHSPHEPLDFQRRPSYNMTIDVADNGETVLSSTCLFVVDLEDVDKNLFPPEFDDVALEASVYENMPINTEVLTVKATDLDNPTATSGVDYNIVGGSGMALFSIDSSGTIRTLQVLDREEQSSYWLTIEANDSPQSRIARTGVLHVFVRVLDRNDHRPVPLLPIYYATVKENSPQNVVVVKIDATDRDDINTKPSTFLRYKIAKGDPQSFFRIDDYTGYITTSGSRRLDRETQREHELWIEVCDSGEPQLCSYVPVVVSIDDINDNAPSFTQSIFHYNIPSGVMGTVCRVFASDADVGKNAELFYNITNGDPRFSINENGYIATNTPAKAEEVFTVTIQVTDRGLPPQMNQAKIIMTAIATKERAKGVVNRAPEFVKNTSKKIPVSDADQVGFTIGKFEAMDPDGDTIWWSIIDGNLNDTFSLKSDSGLLQLSKPIESIHHNISSLILLIQISDGELNDTTEVTVELARSMISRPQFSAQHYKTQISEKTAVGTQIYTVRVINSNKIATAKPLVYGIHSVEDTGMEDKLRVEPSTGTVLLMESIDYEVCHEIRAIIYVRQGTLTNYVTLTITITDDNDNTPRFIHKDYEVILPVRSPIGSYVVSVLALDSDSGDNGVVRYNIISGNELGFFSVDHILGMVRVAKHLPNDHLETILTIRATDGGKYPRSDTTNVRIKISDHDGIEMRMLRSIYQRTVKDSTPLGTVLLVISTKPNEGVRYIMKQPCPYFEIHAASGAVSLIRWLTRERAKSVSCTVVARNRAASEDTAKIVIKIASTNQHAPIFKQQVYRGFIQENNPSGSPVLRSDNSPLRVSATDKDVGPNSLIGYRLLNPSEPYFVIDFVTGAIRSRKPLDYEKVKEWIFYVQASDMGEPKRSSPIPAMVVVSVLDTNDQKPVFTMSIYKVDLLLPTVAGVVVAKPTAIDDDSVGKLRYSIKGGVHPKLFTINSTDGSIVLMQSEPDHLTDTKYEMDVLVSDGVHTVTASVHINVRNASTETNGFRFSQIEYNTNVKENTTFLPGESLLAVTAVGAAEGAIITYSILNEREEVFIHDGTGMISLTGKRFDREKEPVVRLLVQGRTHEANPQLAQTVVVIHVEDINDCSPVFIGLPYDVVVSLDSTVGEKILSVKAVDRDIGINGIVRYHSTTMPSIFKLNKHDGRITVNGKLDVSKVYHFDVVAIDQGSPALKSVQELRINVVERTRPIFVKRQYFASISEGSQKNTNVVKVKASSSVGGHLVYTIEGGDDSNLFVIDMDTGVISVNGDLDAEEMTFYNLSVMARDVTRNNQNSTVDVNIEIIGVNDNGPRFENRIYRINVPESTSIGSKLLTVKAIDSDIGNGFISYAVSGRDSSIVHIDSASGLITLAQILDYEKKQRYEVKLVAADESQLSGDSTLLLMVEDVNDEAPRFSSPFNSAVISDTALPGHFVAIMNVIDDDTVSSIQGGHRFLYSIIEGDETLFNVSGNTGEVTLLRPIDTDDLANGVKKILNVSVSDGLFTAYGQLTVSITVSGRRQLPPRFEQSHYVVAVRENNVLTNKTSILIVQARDGVLPLHYSIGNAESRTRPLRIDKLTGRIHPRIVFDFRNQHAYKVPLVVEDAVGRRAFSTLTVNVIDENDKSPVFVVPKYSVSVSSGIREGEAVLMVFATDDDNDDVVEYTLVGNDEASSLFKIHHRHGTLTVLKPLNSLIDTTVNLVVRATDQANPPHHSTAQVFVSVLPEETPIPKFSNNHYLFVVPEDSVVGSIIGKLQQIDPDVAQAHFSIPDPPNDLPFTVDRTSGKLIVRNALDREEKDVWRFIVRVDSSSGAFSSATVTIQLSDVNDHAPSFVGAHDRISITEDASLGTIFAVFSAIDLDHSPGGMVTFTLVEDPRNDGMFKIDAETGWLVVASPLDRERQASYELVVRATDEGGLFTDHKFKVEVTDVNDEPPRFDEDFYIVSVDGTHLSTGQIIARVVVTDKDLPPFNSIRLFISRGNDDGLFKIDDSGKILIARLNHVQHIYNLTLLAFDGTHATTAIMMVTLTSSTLSTLECDPDKVIAMNVAEDAPRNTVIYHEKSHVHGSSARYLLISSDPSLPFTVNQQTGSISVKAALDAETRKKYTFTRQMELRGITSYCDQSVEVNILDVNDESPIFIQDEFVVSVKENEPATENERYFITRVHAVDRDSGAFGRVKYSLLLNHGIFLIDSETGAITVNRPLDREQNQEYLLRVLAQDFDHNKPKSSEALVRVLVTDQNDNAPVFEKSEYVLQVMESESVGYTLLTLQAVGGDFGETISYTLAENGTHNVYVELNRESGVLKLAKGLDFEVEKLLSLTVIATDSGEPPLSTEAIVTIQVLDENDNVPVFVKESYKASIDENSTNGTKVLQVKALDQDSEHYGRVAYSIIGNPVPFHIDDQGWITVAGLLDWEMKSYYRLQVEAYDGGEPPQKSVVTVLIDVKDVNDNAPVFVDCNMTAVVQEGVMPGHTILTLSITDADGPLFGGPFRVEVHGEGSKAFTVDEQYSLITVTRFDHAKKDRFLLTLIAYDRGNLSTDCPLTVFVREESRHPPRISPLRIVVNTLMGEFKGGTIGTIVAEDEDASDMLRFSLVEGSTVGPLSTESHPRLHATKPHLFRVNQTTGEIWSDHGISGGLHAFNVSVTDGKFTSVSYVEVEVMSLEQDAVDHAISLRIKSMTALEFFAEHINTFRDIFAKHLNVQAKNIQLLSVQETNGRNLRSLESNSKSTDVDILFTVSRGGGRGMLKPDHVYTRLKHDFQSIADQSGKVKYQLTTEMCTPGVCQRGECRERVYLDDQQQTVISVGSVSFVAPRHNRLAECICPEGFGGSSCELEVNACARSPCHPWEMCVPSDDARFNCICPPGSSGERCSKASCTNEGRCAEDAELSVGGNGYFEMSVAHEMETRLELEVELKTTTFEGVILHADGPSDYHILELVDGRVVYRWDAGSGQGSVSSVNSITDAQWHRISVSRRGRRTRLQLDGADTKEGWSPTGSDVINLYSASHRLFFGAHVSRKNSSSISITSAIVACFRSISIDRRSVAKTRQGLRLYSATIGCSAMAATPCSEAPCENGGTCYVVDRTYQCSCPARYSGKNCEIDTDPCGSRPCPLGIQCIPFYNQYLCKCPNGFTGKRCEVRGYDMDDACANEPCGLSGTCIPIPRRHTYNLGYICNCTHGFSGKTCDDLMPSFFDRVSLVELVIAAAILILIVAVIFAIVVVCRCLRIKSEDVKYGEHVHAVTHVRNPHIPPVTTAPPPLPPRAFRCGNQMISNLEQAQLTGLPTVQVRPLPQREQLSSSGHGDSRSPSLVGSGKQWKRATDYGSAADDLNESGRESHDSAALEALRRFGFRIPNDDDPNAGNKNRVRPSERSPAVSKGGLSSLNHERVPLAESIQCLPTMDDDNDGEKWGDGVDRIGAAIQMERLRIESLTSRVKVGDTVLSPVVNDDDYMTMRPRRNVGISSESQRCPLLYNGNDSDGVDEFESHTSQAPPPPSHKNLFNSRVYDDPPDRGGDTISLDTSAPICDIDASDIEDLPIDSVS